MWKRMTVIYCGFTLAISIPFTIANATELISNGGFETGDFTGWTVFDLAGGSGSFFVDNDTTNPISSFSTVGPASGSFYAVSDQPGPGAHALLQSFTVPVETTSISLTFDMFVNDKSKGGAIIDPAGLDLTEAPNQHARVDILTAEADPLSTAATDVVSNVFLGSDDSGPNPYTTFSQDLSGELTPGDIFQIRFAEVDNQGNFNQGVDNVSIDTDAEFSETNDGASESTPLLPADPPDPETGQFDIALPDDLGERQTIWIDPPVSVGFEYIVDNAFFDSITAPSLSVVNDTDGYTITVDGTTFNLAPGGVLDFDNTTPAFSNVDEFTLTGIDPTLGLDPNNSAAFPLGVSLEDITSPATVFMTPITQTQAVSGPPTGWLVVSSTLSLLLLSAGAGRRGGGMRSGVR